MEFIKLKYFKRPKYFAKQTIGFSITQIFAKILTRVGVYSLISSRGLN